MAELVDAPDLGSGSERSVSSILIRCTKEKSTPLSKHSFDEGRGVVSLEKSY